MKQEEAGSEITNSWDQTKLEKKWLYQCPLPKTRPSWEHWLMLNKGRSPEFNITIVLSKA